MGERVTLNGKEFEVATNNGEILLLSNYAIIVLRQEKDRMLGKYGIYNIDNDVVEFSNHDPFLVYHVMTNAQKIRDAHFDPETIEKNAQPSDAVSRGIAKFAEMYNEQEQEEDDDEDGAG